MLNGGSMVWGVCVYFVYMIPLETDVLRKHRFQKLPLKPYHLSGIDDSQPERISSMQISLIHST